MISLFRYICLATAAISLWACSSEEAQKPVYLRLDAIYADTDYAEEGSAHQRFTTAWVYINQEPVGAFELPATVPMIMPEGDSELLIFPGINTNGIRSFRSINDAFRPIRITVTKPIGPGVDTLVLTPEQLTTTYQERYNVVVLEDFDEPGLAFEKDINSDTNFIRINDRDSIFQFIPQGDTLPEPNNSSGLIILDENNNFVELASVAAYPISQGVQNVYLEVTYRTNNTLFFGLIADYPGGSQQAVTAAILPKKEWNKIYINLITEIQAFPGANGYKVFLTATKSNEVEQARIYLDNLKLIYE
jgi:hypothetical protein